MIAAVSKYPLRKYFDELFITETFTQSAKIETKKQLKLMMNNVYDSLCLYLTTFLSLVFCFYILNLFIFVQKNYPYHNDKRTFEWTKRIENQEEENDFCLTLEFQFLNAFPLSFRRLYFFHVLTLFKNMIWV